MNKHFPTDDGKVFISLWKRIELIDRNISLGKKIIIFIYPAPDASTFRYRVYNIYKNNLHYKEIYTSFFYSFELEDVNRILFKASVVTFVRTPWIDGLSDLVVKLKLSKIAVGFDVDDYIFDVRKAPLIANHINANVDYLINYSAKLDLIARLADFFTTTNSFLCEKLNSFYCKPSFIIHNTFNEDQRMSSFYHDNEKENDIFKVGYISGSPSHKNDLLLCMEQMSDFLSESYNAVLFICGYIDLPNRYASLVNDGKIRFHPFVNYIKLQGLIASCHINIAPLVQNEFTDCKSELKWFESALVKVASCVSPTKVYLKTIQNNIDGVIVEDNAWYDTMKSLYNSKQKLDRIGNSAYEICNKKYSPESLLHKVECIYLSIIQRNF